MLVNELDMILGLRLETCSSLWQNAETIAEQLESLGETESIEQWLAYLKIDVTPPHARLSSLLRRGAYERRCWMKFFEVLDNGNDLGIIVKKQ